MKLDFSSEIPIYIQIAQSIEDGILNGIYKEDEVIPSTTEISVKFKINPATVAKGFNLLVDEGIIYKRRGVGMFVSSGSKEILVKKRRESFYSNYVVSLIEEARRLNISTEDIIEMIKKGEQ
ncbi:GntR family transcriptional regulator [Clostridium sp. Sa3CUN1]|uniref:GntR family transcriptional regulator n=1 Tax=Clostridium gallinarum TaxID=2762246 RepID=A0ABR8Q6L6_9CLOT|nr:GntR family transcriptional regulator [Clostridium gallinarum]MBD7916034.1 GntR family transcriptional regulator [Clostridium gallinarum]